MYVCVPCVYRFVGVGVRVNVRVKICAYVCQKNTLFNSAIHRIAVQGGEDS